MSDWKSRAVPVKSTNDWMSRAQSADATPAASLQGDDANPGMVDALMRGAENGATFGFAPRILAGGQALYDSLFNDANFSDDYNKNKDYNDAMFSKTEQAHPYLYGAGNLAGGAAMAIPLGAAGLAGEGVAGAAKLGAATGALQGFSGSKAQDLTGELKDAAAGAAGGGLLGGAIGGAADKFGGDISDYAGSLLSKLKGGASAVADLEPLQLTKDSFTQGLSGRKLFGRAGNEALNNDFIDAVRGAGNTVDTALNAATGAKQANLMGSADKTIDLSDFAKDALNMISEAKRNNPVAADHADLGKIQDLLTNYFLGDQQAGISGKGFELSPADAENLLRKLGSLGSEGDNPLNTTLGKALANRLTTSLDRAPNLMEQSFLGHSDDFKALKNVINDSIPGLSDQNSQISQLLTAKDQLPSLTDVANMDNVGKSGLGSTDRLDQFFSSLPDDVRQKIEPQLQDVATARKIADRISSPGLSHSPFSIADTARGAYYKGANMAGLASKAMYELTPDALKTVASTVNEIGSDTANQLSALLSQAAEKDHMSRNALLFAIQQNPKYREILSQFPEQSTSK